MATIVKTVRGWKAVVRRVGWPTASKSFKTKREAEHWARDVENEIDRGVYTDRTGSTRITIAEALARYQSSVTIRKKQSTQDAEVGRVKLLTQDLGKYTLQALSAKQVAQYRDAQLALGQSANTVRLKLALLSHLYTIARREWGMGIQVNPVADIAKPRCIARDRRISKEQLNKLFTELRKHSNPMLAIVVELLTETAMRKSELLGLKRHDVDLIKRTAILRDTKNGSARLVPLRLRATELMTLALANAARSKETELIFPGEPGKDGVRRGYEIAKLFANACKRLGLSNYRIHDLRHEATSQLVEMQLSDLQVSTITGHKSMQMLKRYTHLRSEDLIKSLDDRDQKCIA